MTAATVTKHVAQHAAVKEPSRHWPGSFRLPRRSVRTIPVVEVRAQRVTATGQALYSVDAAGIVERTAIERTRDGFATFALSGGTAIQRAYPNHWLIEWFETEEQRRDRINAHAVATVLQLLGKLARR